MTIPSRPPATNAQEQLEFRTDDMALAAYLRTRGHAHARLDKEGRSCRWVYSESTSLRQKLDDYYADEAYVEPREFMRKVGLVREELYAFLGVEAKRINA